MNRSMSALIVILSVCMLAMPVSAQSSRSGGIGLSREGFEEAYGPGEPGQTLISYVLDDGSVLSVELDDEIISYIEVDLTVTAEGGLLEPDAEDLAESLLPADIERNERYTMPDGPTVPGMFMVVETFESDWLDDDVFRDRENVSVVYVYEQMESSMDSHVTALYLAVED